MPPLVGIAFHRQMIPFELNGAFALTSITATNSLRLAAGDF